MPLSWLFGEFSAGAYWNDITRKMMGEYSVPDPGKKTIHKNVQMHIKWEWILECNLFCDRISLLKNVQMHGNGECNNGD